MVDELAAARILLGGNVVVAVINDNAIAMAFPKKPYFLNFFFIVNTLSFINSLSLVLVTSIIIQYSTVFINIEFYFYRNFYFQTIDTF